MDILPLLILPLLLVLIGARCMRCGYKRARDRCDRGERA
jgi:hypothetical protein